jgi:5-methylcytosine-specific restriction protein A
MRNEPETTPCGLCGRGCLGGLLTQHHCRPKSKGGTRADVELVCSQCHGMVHATFTNQTLAQLYLTLDQLRTAPELASFIKWVRKQPPSRRKRNKQRQQKV